MFLVKKTKRWDQYEFTTSVYCSYRSRVYLRLERKIFRKLCWPECHFFTFLSLHRWNDSKLLSWCDLFCCGVWEGYIPKAARQYVFCLFAAKKCEKLVFVYMVMSRFLDTSKQSIFRLNSGIWIVKNKNRDFSFNSLNLIENISFSTKTTVALWI